MHEYSVVQALLGQVERAAAARGATSVHRVRISVGELCGVEPALLATAWTTFRERTICAEAELDLQAVQARWACPRCELTVERGAFLRCTECGGPARLVQGDELTLERLELEVP